MMKFKKLTDTAHAPTKAHTFDAGWDLYADEHIAIMPGTRQVVKTGIALDIPQGHAGLIWPRSGLAARYGVDVLGGVVDSGYQGEVQVVLVNHGEYTYTAAPGARIAQIVFHPIWMGAMIETEEFHQTTTRSDSGFGSTGV
jgi:dUTP pyrophosphatase